MTLFRVVDLKQYIYCPRLIYLSLEFIWVIADRAT
jgi:hypothetical protein